MRGLTFFLVSTVLLAGSIVATVLYAEESPATLAVVVPVMIASFFGMLQPLMWLLSRFGLPTPDPGVTPVDETCSSGRCWHSRMTTRRSASSAVVTTSFCAWKLAEAKWFEFLERVNLQQDYQLRLRLMPETRTVRAIEITKRCHKRVGLGTYSVSWIGFRGWQPFAVHKEWAAGVAEAFPPRVGTLYTIDFNARVFRKPVLDAIVARSWTIQPCTLSLRWGI